MLIIKPHAAAGFCGLTADGLYKKRNIRLAKEQLVKELQFSTSS